MLPRQSLERKPCLVIGCGKTCQLHQDESFWLSFDTTSSTKPDLCKPSFAALTSEDIARQNLGQNKFLAIFIEHAHTMKPSVSELKKHLCSEDGRLIYYGWKGSWNEFQRAGLEIDSFISYKDKLVLITKSTDFSRVFEDTLALIRGNLIHKQTDEGFWNFLSLFETTHRQLTDRFYTLDPLLISILAHVNVYIAKRLERKPKAGFSFLPARNKFRDKDYNEVPKIMEEMVENFASKRIMLVEVNNQIKELKRQFPSTFFKGSVTHTPLNEILNMCFEAMTYYDSKERPTPNLRI